MAIKSMGIVGCGAIGKALVRAVEAGKLAVRIAGVTSRSEKSAREFLAAFKNPPPYLPLDELIDASDLLVEAAGGHVVAELARKTFAAGKDLMVISVGALLEHPEIMAESRRTGCRLYVPSGAIAGLDGIKSACVGAITHVTHTTRKPPLGLEGAPYLVERGISLAGLQEETEVFSGSARRGLPRLSRQRQRYRRGKLGGHRSRTRRACVSSPCPACRATATTSTSKASSASCMCISKTFRAKIPRPAS